MFLIRRTLPLLALAFASSLCAAAKPGEAEALRCFELRDSEPGQAVSLAERTLAELVGGTTGADVSIDQLQVVADALTAAYQHAGFAGDHAGTGSAAGIDQRGCRIARTQIFLQRASGVVLHLLLQRSFKLPQPI